LHPLQPGAIRGDRTLGLKKQIPISRAADEEDPDVRNRFRIDDGASGVGTDDFCDQIGMDPYKLSEEYASQWIGYDQDIGTLTDAQRVGPPPTPGRR